MQWLYTGDITSNEHPFSLLLNARKFAQDLEDSDYFLAAGKTIIETFSAPQATISCQQIVALYNAPQGSRARQRKFLVDLCAARPSLVKLTSELPVQFLLDLTQKFLSTRPIQGLDLHEALSEHLPLSEEEQEISDD